MGFFAPGVFAIFLAYLGLVITLFCLQMLVACFVRNTNKPADVRRPSVAVLVPAHNEELNIRHTLLSIRTQLLDGDRLLVVADNCTDKTAEIAIDCGADVSVRSNVEEIGKGFALDFGIGALRESPPEVVLIIDADCVISSGSIKILASRAIIEGRPVQALNMMLAPSGSGLMTRIAGFAWLVHNLVRPLGYMKFGQPCQLMGTGMAFPWRLISEAQLGNGHLVEDVVLGLELAERGYSPRFCPEALVTSYFPLSRSGLAAQRYRWEHGHLSVITKTAPRALWLAIRDRNLQLGMLAVDLMVPPLALLILTVGIVWGGAVSVYLLGGIAWPFAVSSCLVLILIASLTSGWWRFGRDYISFWDLFRGAGYVFWKIPLYIRFIARKQVAWIRSER